MAEKNERDFKGVWIKKELYLTKDLSWTEKILYTEIDSLNKEKGCYAGNEHFADFLNVKTSTVSNAISKLKSFGLVRLENFDGRKRILRSCPEGIGKLRSRVLKIGRQGFKNHTQKNTSTNTLKEGSSISLRKDIEKGKPEFPDQTSNSPNPSARPTLETASSEIPVKGNNRPTKDDGILPRKKLPAKHLAYENASDEARSLVEDWNELPTTPAHKKGSKIVMRALHALDETLLKDHTPKVIFRTMLDFSNMQKDAESYRVPAKKVNIDDFFIGNGYLNGRRERRGEPVEPTWFQKLVLPGSFAKYLRREDSNPEVTEEFRYRYRRHVLADQGVAFGPRRELQFREASRQLVKFMKRGRLEKFLDKVDYRDYVRCLLDALIDKYKKVTEIEVGHLCSDYTWNEVFPKFIAFNWEE